MAGGELTARRRVAVVARSVSMAGGEVAARRKVVASNGRPCFQPKTDAGSEAPPVLLPPVKRAAATRGAKLSVW